MPFSLCLLLGALAAAPRPAAAQPTWLPGAVTARPTAPQLAWEARQVGVMITWNLQSACLPPSHANASAQPCQAGGFLPTRASLSSWAPSVNMTDWLAVSASFGARYAVLVVDHFSGFLLWPSATTAGGEAPPSLADTASPTPHDLVSAFAAAAARQGLAPGYFYSVHDNWWAGVNEFVAGHRRWGSSGAPLSPAAYDALAAAQLAELLAVAAAAPGGAPTAELWFDAGVNATLTPSIGALVARLAPGVACHSCAGFDQRPGGGGVGLRWMGNEQAVMPLPNWGAVGAAYTPFGGDPLGAIYAPASCDTVLSEHNWFNARTMAYDKDIRSACSLASAYLTSVGRGCNLILNLAPDYLGAVSAPARAAYAGLGAAAQCLHARPLGGGANLTLYSAAGNPSGALAWALPAPLPPAPCGAGQQCWSLALQLSERTADSGQRIAAWGVQGCFAGAGSDCDGGQAQWVALTGAGTAVPANATVGIGARRWVRLQHSQAAAPGAALVALRVAVASAYPWGGAGGAAPGRADLVLETLEVFDWQGAGACVPGCALPAY